MQIEGIYLPVFWVNRWAIKQENLTNMGQWKHSKVENPEWNKKAYSWPVEENGDINEDFDWPMEGYFIPYAPPMKKPKEAKISQQGIGFAMIFIS